VANSTRAPKLLSRAARLPQLLLTSVDLQGRMRQSGATDRLIVRHLDHGDVVVALSEREERHLHLLEHVHQLHAEGLSPLRRVLTVSPGARGVLISRLQS